jgi:hypothetical protein
MSEPATNRWLRTRVPGKVGIVLSVLIATCAATFAITAMSSGGTMWFLAMSLPVFALACWSLAASVIKLREERRPRK